MHVSFGRISYTFFVSGILGYTSSYDISSEFEAIGVSTPLSQQITGAASFHELCLVHASFGHGSYIFVNKSPVNDLSKVPVLNEAHI